MTSVAVNEKFIRDHALYGGEHLAIVSGYSEYRKNKEDRGLKPLSMMSWRYRFYDAEDIDTIPLSHLEVMKPGDEVTVFIDNHMYILKIYVSAEGLYCLTTIESRIDAYLDQLEANEKCPKGFSYPEYDSYIKHLRSTNQNSYGRALFFDWFDIKEMIESGNFCIA